MREHTTIGKIILFGFVALVVGVSNISSAFADTPAQLRQKIDQKTQDISQLEDQIKQYESQLNTIGKQKDTLATAVESLDISQKKLDADIAVTQKKIEQVNLQIQQLDSGIQDKQQQVSDGRDTLAQTIRTMNEEENRPLVEVMLSDDSLSAFLNDINQLADLQKLVQKNIATLKSLKTDLEAQKTSQQVAKTKLVALSSQLSDQEQIVKDNKAQKQKLLDETKNKESNYQQLLADSKAKRDAFQKELYDYQAQLKVAIDPNSYPSAGTQVFSWPVSHVIITQYFGDTPFANTHQALYSGHGHDGVDFGVPVGTPVMAAADGTVLGTGNTDLTCPHASFGKWVFIKHNMGLSAIYAHLSLIKVKAGDIVKQGQVIGYSGATGYVTGPHLHFGVYVSQAAQIGHLKSNVCNATYTMPLAPFNGYLNPLNYLPPYTGPQPS